MAALFEPFVWMLGIVVNIYFTVVLAEVVLHWLVRFGIVDVKNVYVAKISELLAKATGPVYKKISEKVPAVSGFDFSPFILLLVLLFLGRFIYRLDLLRIPQKVRNFIRRSWEEDDLSLYGRFDFALVDGQLKMLEFNADTPTSLLEAAVVQWQWKEDVFPANDQFNGIHEGLVASWKDIHKAYRCDQYFFASVSDFEEDNMTLKYLIATAIEAGLVTGEIDIEDIMHVNGTLYASPENPISCMFKLFPWETMFEQNPDACMTEMCWLEPLWKSLMSDKAMLPILHELFPHSPYILPAFFEPGKLSSYCRKPVFSREGANIRLVRNGLLLEESGGEYGKEGHVYQQLVEIPAHNGWYPVIGSWVIGGEPAGIGIRETTSRITDNMSHFVPHIIL